MEMVWDASKAYMRGTLIHMNNKYKLKQQKKRKEIEEEIKKKEQLLIINPGDKKVKETINILREQFNMLIVRIIDHSHLWLWEDLPDLIRGLNHDRSLLHISK